MEYLQFYVNSLLDSLISTGSTGELNIYQIDVSLSKSRQENEYLTVENSVNLSDTYSFQFNKNNTSIKYQSATVKLISTNTSHSIVAVGISASSPTSTLVTVWDTKHMTILANTTLPSSTSGSARDLLIRDVAKSIDNSYIMVAQGDRIAMCQLSIPNITLASAMMNAQSNSVDVSSLTLFPAFLGDVIENKETIVLSVSIRERANKLLEEVTKIQKEIKKEKVEGKEKYARKIESLWSEYLSLRNSVQEGIPDHVSQVCSVVF